MPSFIRPGVANALAHKKYPGSVSLQRYPCLPSDQRNTGNSAQLSAFAPYTSAIGGDLIETSDMSKRF